MWMQKHVWIIGSMQYTYILDCIRLYYICLLVTFLYRAYNMTLYVMMIPAHKCIPVFFRLRNRKRPGGQCYCLSCNMTQWAVVVPTSSPGWPCCLQLCHELWSDTTRKHETFSLCWFKVGQASQMLAQHLISTGWCLQDNKPGSV